MERYAVYFAPRAGSALAMFGALWLGWDAAAGAPVLQPEAKGFTSEELGAFTVAPRRYGFHGTLKPPFRLAEGTSYNMLRDAVVALAGTMNPIDMGPFKLKRLKRFLALVPAEASSSLEDLAGRCVTELDPFRAPAPASEIDKRRKANLTARQDELLLQWGYPYVLEQFRFHLTLTGSLDDADLARVESHLAGQLDAIIREPVVLSDLCLFGDPGNGQFCRIVERVPLRAG